MFDLLRFILFICSLSLAPVEFVVSAQRQQAGSVVEIKSLDQIEYSQVPQTIYFFDIDDILFGTPSMLGSRTWRTYFRQASKQDSSHNWHDIFSLFLARHYPLQTVESLTGQCVRALHGVFGLTARERTKWYDTAVASVDQLKSIGIDFDLPQIADTYSDLTKDSEYFKGVFFANQDLKGDYLLKLFKNVSRLPSKINFIDDKKSQVDLVALALHQLGIDHQCYWYPFTEAKTVLFDPLSANIQLYYFWASEGRCILSDAEAALIAEQDPSKEEALSFKRKIF